MMIEELIECLNKYDPKTRVFWHSKEECLISFPAVAKINIKLARKNMGRKRIYELATMYNNKIESFIAICPGDVDLDGD